MLSYSLPAQFCLYTIEFCHHRCPHHLTVFLRQFRRMNPGEVALEVKQNSVSVNTSAVQVNAVGHKALEWLQDFSKVRDLTGALAVPIR